MKKAAACLILLCMVSLNGCTAGGEKDPKGQIKETMGADEEAALDCGILTEQGEEIWEERNEDERGVGGKAAGGKGAKNENTADEKSAKNKNTADGKKQVAGTDEKAGDKTENPHKLLNYDDYPNEKYAWWFKRNETHSQPEAQQEVDIAQYDAWYVDPKQTKKVVYLTFDCGYENGFTPAMLDALKKHKAKGVFFITKHFAKDAADIVKRMKKEGHYVGNHTAQHPDLTAMDTRSIKVELKDCEEAVEEFTGYKMDPFFRPPKGEYSEKVLKIAQDMGYKTLFWSLAYLDYDVNNQPGREYVVEHYKKYIHPGAIPLIHNVSESNAQALDQVLTDLEAEGYRFGDPAKIGEK